MGMRIAILGMGAVGMGILQAILGKNTGLIVTAVADSRSGCIDPDGLNVQALLDRKRSTGMCGETSITADAIVQAGMYDVLVEVTPTDAMTGEPATSYIREALSRGKHVVTSNKGPVALHYHDLSSLAKINGVQFRFEATVAGAIPIIHTLLNSLGGNEIQSLYGVLNGTCNYILTRMAEEGLTYKQALDEARTLGYAEADPTYDVKGIDAAIKLVILSNTVWNKSISLNDVDVTGIDLLTEEALRLADQQDATIRLIGEIIPAQNVYRLCPRIIPKDHPLVVHGSLNAIIVRTDLAGELVFVGKGAGSLETASAVLGDILSIRNTYAGGN